MEENVFEGLAYLVSYPEGFCEDQKYPLVIFLHGAGSRSKTTERLRKNRSLSYVRKRQNQRGYIILAPLCNAVNWNERMTILLHLVERFRTLSYVDDTRIYLTGNSMGGYGTWALSILRPDWFAAAMPLCGGGLCGYAKRLIDLPIRAFHGLRDQVVDPMESMLMAKAVNMAGGCAELILFPKNAHDIWADVYDDDKNYDWLFSFTNVREKTPVEKIYGDYYD